ncbi:MAG TPA: SIMPL domain-containing protein, partial [Gemmatimonadaceae bacterium]|nr:SIMPL domain-containing protein [Gemmatimonadaceae bacterium]
MMRRGWLWVVGILAMGRMSVHAQVATTSGATGPEITASGQGDVRVTPDRATIYLGVQTRASTAAAAAADNARTQRDILDTLRAIGFTSQELSTM